ncbi:MAG: hypothetical protein IKV38_02645 [Clostridia bacterium]|nr:hypothetical protein [Clostridia bacterium]
MKRFFTILLVTCIALSGLGVFAGCEKPQDPPQHQHTVSQQWTKDDNHHWHVCQETGCNEIFDKAQHDWTGDDAFTCTVCGQTKTQTPTEPSLSGEVTKEQWDLAVVIEKFNNVTKNYGFVQSEMGEVKSEILIAGEKVIKKMLDVGLVVGYAGEQAQAQKDMVLNLFVGLIADYQNFTYDEQEGVYLSTTTITTTVTDEVSGYTATESLTNGKVKFSSDYTVESLTCDMTETIYMNGQLIHTGQYNDMVFTFKDFGTTVVDFKTEVPYIPQANYTQVTEEQWRDSMSIKFDCQLEKTMTLLANGEFYYVMEDGYIRSGNVIKFSDWYISIEGDKYFEYNCDEDGNWTKKEIDEEDYINLATFAELTEAFSQATYDEQTGLYVCNELDVGNGDKYYNFKIGFVDGKVAYVYYEDKEEDGMKPVYQCYFEYETIEVTLPTINEQV